MTVEPLGFFCTPSVLDARLEPLVGLPEVAANASGELHRFRRILKATSCPMNRARRPGRKKRRGGHDKIPAIVEGIPKAKIQFRN
jgi:hypothetical protein